MRELSTWVFEVIQDEEVSVAIVSVGFQGSFVGFGVDQQTLRQLEGPDYTIHLTASKPEGQAHLIAFEFNFPTSALNDARYDLNFSGSRGETFTRSVSKSDASHDRDIIFMVGGAAQPPEQEKTGEDLNQETRRITLNSRVSRDLVDAISGKIGRPPKSGGMIKIHTISLQRETLNDLRTRLSKIPIDRKFSPARILLSARKESMEDLLQGLERALSGGGKPEKLRKFGKPGGTTIRLKGDTAMDLLSALQGQQHYAKAKPPATAQPEEAIQGGEEEVLVIQPQPSPPRPALSKEARSKPRVVNVGFAAQETPSKRISPQMPLACNRPYFFWLEVGRLLKGNIEEKPVDLPKELPPDAALKVVLFSYEGELQIERGAEVGQLRLEASGSVTVESPAALPPGLKTNSRLLKRRLFFPVRTPKREGAHRLRCNIYYKQFLIQSRLVRAQVAERPRSAERALHSTVDYRLAHTLSAAHLAGIQPHRLSIMLNDNGNGTHGFRFWGEGAADGREFKQDAGIDGQKLQDLINQARGGLRKISWGDEEQWQASKPYRYERTRTFDDFKDDLIAIAKRGYKFYDGIVDHFTKGASQTADQLAELMLKPGYVQIALKKSATLLIPASLIYDYPLDDGLKMHKICAEFKNDYKTAAPVEQSKCFNGLCPSRGQLDTVCPSGFWGYRHCIGLPLSLAGAENAPTQIDWQNAPQLTVAMSTNLGLYRQHEKALETQFKAKWPALGWNCAETRALTIEYMKEKAPQLIYFYCHGGLESNAPYIKVGTAADDKLTRGNLRAYRIRWSKPRPLVFINGCHTTAVEPEQALDFVSGFVDVANASGVIGTEITVFESLASRFGEECLRLFIVEGQDIGQAVRGARLAMLKQGNPLGLVYIPFVMAGLKMHQEV
jgi:hypothetical protein